MSMETLDQAVVDGALARQAAAVDRAMPPQLEDLRGRGIIIPAGGARYFACAWVCAKRLRSAGCTLPIEFWHLGPLELDETMSSLVAELGVACVDALKLPEAKAARRLNGWELKAFSLMYCRFVEVLLIDADNVAVKDPTFLFEESEFRDRGAVFWPDFGRLGVDREIWRLCNVPFRDEPEFETGQLLVDRSRCWRELSLAWHYNNYSDLYYQFIHGDKDTFHMAWRALGSEYTMIPHAIHALEGTMCQHDFAGARLFQHRNMLKWSLWGGNPHVDDFWFEEECLEHLRVLGREWDGQIGLPEPSTDSGREAAKQVTQQALFTYYRVGYDSRVLRIVEGGIIVDGAAEMERRWFIDDSENIKLCLVGDRVTCSLELSDTGYWHGRWCMHEKMPILLEPIATEGGACD